jgi:hypothetical protein
MIAAADSPAALKQIAYPPDAVESIQELKTMDASQRGKPLPQARATERVVRAAFPAISQLKRLIR